MTTTRISADSWRDRAACKGRSDLFDERKDDERNLHGRLPRRHVEAKLICQGCPVNLPCLLWALHEEPEEGPILGGHTGPERRVLRKRLGLPQPKRRSLKEWVA